MPLSPLPGTLGIQRARHLLGRLTFGASQAQVTEYAGLSAPAALQRLLQVTTLPEPPRLPLDPDGKLPPDYDWTSLPAQEDEPDFALRNSLLAWWLGGMATDTSALEKFTFFLHCILTTKLESGGSSRDLYWQNTLLRQYLLNDWNDQQPTFNRYTQLIRHIITDNSMLHFLDGRLNVDGRPNENFAREMFELYTLGKGPVVEAGNYTTFTEHDIKEAARVLTGWTTVDWKTADAFTAQPDTGLPSGRVRFNADTGRANGHDNGPKTFSSAFGGYTITPTSSPASPESMAEEVDQLVAMIFQNAAAARYLVRRLYRFFVHWHVTEEIEQSVIQSLTQTFQASGFRLRPVLEELFTSSHFYEAASPIQDDKFGALIKSPLEITIGTVRYFHLRLPARNTAAHNELMNQWLGLMRGMGLDLMNPYDVAGYEAYHQAPAYNRNWITTNTLANRYAFINKLLSNQLLITVNLLDWANDPRSGITDALATTAEEISERQYALPLVTHVARQVLPYAERTSAITLERYVYFSTYHLGGLDFDNWRFTWNTRANGNADIRADAEARLQNLFNALMQSPEYQLY